MRYAPTPRLSLLGLLQACKQHAVFGATIQVVGRCTQSPRTELGKRYAWRGGGSGSGSIGSIGSSSSIQSSRQQSHLEALGDAQDGIRGGLHASRWRRQG